METRLSSPVSDIEKELKEVYSTKTLDNWAITWFKRGYPIDFLEKLVRQSTIIPPEEEMRIRKMLMRKRRRVK